MTEQEMMDLLQSLGWALSNIEARKVHSGAYQTGLTQHKKLADKLKALHEQKPT